MKGTHSKQYRLGSLLWIEASLVGVLATVALSVPEAKRALLDLRLTTWTAFHRWKAQQQQNLNLRNEVDAGTQLIEIRNVLPNAKLIQVIALGAPNEYVIRSLKEQLKRQSENRVLHHLIIVYSEEHVSNRLRKELPFPNLSIHSDPSGELHRKLNAYFTPRWYLLSGDGVLLRKQEPNTALGQCGCGQR